MTIAEFQEKGEAALKACLLEVDAVSNLDELNVFKGRHLGKKSALTGFYQMMRSTMYSGDRTRLCPRVRFDPRYKTPSFSWERIEQHVLPGDTGHKPKKEKGKGRSYMAFVRMKGAARKEKAKVVLTSRHLKINRKTHALSAAAFEGEPEWARVAGELIERKLSVLRRQNRALSNISRAVHRFKSLVHEKESSSEVVV